MIDYAPYPEEVFAPREAPIANDLADYIAELVERAPGKIIFRTGAGRVERDLLLHWPVIQGGEDEAQRLCKKISEAVFPLLGSLYAQGVELSVLISNDGLEPPRHVEAMATWVVFDAAERLERTMFLSPRRDVPPSNALRAARGVAVHSTPLNYRYHTLKDDRSRKQHTHVGIYELPERLIAEMYEEPPYVPLSAEQKKILDVVKAKVYELRQTVPRWEEKVEKVPSQPIPTVTALSALPPPVRALEHQVMGYAMDKELSPDFRMGLRRVAQSLRQAFPQASIEEAARLETAPGPVPVAAPRFYLSPQTEEARSLAPATAPVIVSGAVPSLARAGVIGPPYYATMRHLPPAYQPVASYAPPQNLATVRYLPVPEYQGSANLATLKYAPATVFPTVHYAEPLSLLPTGMAPSPRYEGPVNLATLKYAPAAIFPIASYTGPANLEALRYIPAASLPTAEYASLAHLATAIYPPASIGPIVRYQEPSLLPVTRYAGPSNLMTPQYLPAGGPPTVQYAGPPVFASLEYLPSAALPTAEYAGPVNLPAQRFIPPGVGPIPRYQGPPALAAPEYAPPGGGPIPRYQGPPALAIAEYAPPGGGPIPRYQGPPALAAPEYAPPGGGPIPRYQGPPALAIAEYAPPGVGPIPRYQGPPALATPEYAPPGVLPERPGRPLRPYRYEGPSTTLLERPSVQIPYEKPAVPQMSGPPTPALPTQAPMPEKRASEGFEIEIGAKPISPSPVSGTEYLLKPFRSEERLAFPQPKKVTELMLPAEGGEPFIPEVPVERYVPEEALRPTRPGVLPTSEPEAARPKEPERKEVRIMPEVERVVPEEKPQPEFFAAPLLKGKPPRIAEEEPMPIPQPRHKPEFITQNTYLELKQTPTGFTKAVLVGDAGKLQNKTKAELVKNVPKPHTFDRTRKPKSWDFPTPGLEPFPRAQGGRKKR